MKSMSITTAPKAAIVNYEMGNLFSVQQACDHVGLGAVITSSTREILSADAVILPGVGAFGDAMETLKTCDLVETLQEVAASATPFVGVCLGMQLLLNESHEFGVHQGLGIIPGSVVPFENPMDTSGKRLKVPQVGWNRIYSIPQNTRTGETPIWNNSMLAGIPEGEFMYFVHSYYVVPEVPEVSLTFSRYGDIEFCSSLQYRNVFAFQFHPERSGPEGLKVYENLLTFIKKN